MTRPPARPKPGLYFIVTCAGGAAVSVPRETRSEAELVRSRNDRSCGDRPHRIVECVPMPRVRVRYIGNAYGEEQHEVSINGATVVTGPKDYADKTARDLRRALRGK